MAVEIMDDKGTIFPLPLKEIRKWRYAAAYWGVGVAASLMKQLGYPLEVALAVLAR